MRRAELEAFMSDALRQAPGATDYIFTPGRPALAEQDGKLTPIELEGLNGPLLPFHTENLARRLLGRNMNLYAALTQRGSCDLSYELPEKARFRVNVYSQRGSLSFVMRRLPAKLPSLEKLRLPKALLQIASEHMGLALMTGATGTGKSTSMAAVIELINSTRPAHIITLEDPIEFLHPHKKGTVSQREAGWDFGEFADGLRAALRQAPKVIAVGEIRDRDTMEIAMQAAETGHLVLSTLHTADASQTVNRIVGMFDPSEERTIRQRLSESLKYVVSQRLVPRVGGGRVAAFEVVVNNLRVREAILNGEEADRTFKSIVESGQAHGMFTFEESLARLYEEKLITEETANAHASDRGVMSRMMDRIKGLKGENRPKMNQLTIDH